MNKPIAAHAWAPEANEHYVENCWVGHRLFAEEKFVGDVLDPCCGFGRIVMAARAAGLRAIGMDIVDRGFADCMLSDFLTSDVRAANMAFNPPFTLGQEFAERALRNTTGKVAMVYPTRRLNAAGKWLSKLPLYRIWYLTPRPSMPPGHVALDLEQKGKEPQGGKQDFCILVFLHGYEGEPSARWLRRDA